MSTADPARSPRALALSVLLHASIAAVVLVFAYCGRQRPEEQPQIFELVAGEGDDYAALEAPTTAAPAIPTVQVDLPDPAPIVVPQPQPEQVAPKIERAPEPRPTPREVTPPPPKKVEKKAVEKTVKKTQPKADAKRTTFDNFRKEHGEPKTTTAKAAPKITPKKINAESIAGRVASGSTNSAKAGAGGTALTRAETDLWTAYQAFIVQRIRRAMEAAGVTDLRSARVEFRVSAEGVVSAARITGSSGNGEFDEAVLAALRSIGRLGPPPTGRTETLSVMIEMRERS